MAKREILQVENPEQNRILRQKSKRITIFNDPSLQRQIDDMIETMRDAHGVGLAAPQVGVLNRLVVIEVPKDMEDEPLAGKIFVLINPEILKVEDEWEPVEGCLSYPGWEANVKRSYRVWAKAKDRKGRDYKINAAEGLLAQALQHEIDHLNGVLFFDHLPSMDLLRRTDDEERRRRRQEQIAQAKATQPTEPAASPSR